MAGEAPFSQAMVTTAEVLFSGAAPHPGSLQVGILPAVLEAAFCHQERTRFEGEGGRSADQRVTAIATVGGGQLGGIWVGSVGLQELPEAGDDGVASDTVAGGWIALARRRLDARCVNACLVLYVGREGCKRVIRVIAIARDLDLRAVAAPGAAELLRNAIRQWVKRRPWLSGHCSSWN